MKIDQILKQVSKHIQLDPDEAEYFLSLLQEKTINQHEFLLRQGEVCRAEYFINRGCLRTYIIDKSGEEQVLQFGMEDWWVGDLYSFLTQSPSNCYIDALEDTEVLYISKTDLDKLYKRVPKFDKYFRLVLQQAIVAQQSRINQDASLSLEERYHSFLKKYPHLEQRVPQKLVASYLGTTPVSLSSLRKRMVAH